MNAAQEAAIEEYGPFNDGESERWAAVQNIWKEVTMPASIAWAALFTPGVVCIVADIVRLQITGLFFLGVVLLIIWAWALGVFTPEFWTPRSPRAVSPDFEDAQSLSRFDRLDGLDTRIPNPERNTK